MNPIWYISPSNQGANIGAGDYGTEREQMYLLAGEITPHLDRAGVSFVVPEKSATLTQRVQESNGLPACFHLALHSNAGGGGTARGCVGYYYSEAGKTLCEKLTRALLALGQESNRESPVVQNRGLYELRKTTAPAALLEVDFHDNPAGVKFLTGQRSAIAQAIARVIIEAAGKEFVPETPGERVDRAVSLGLVEPNGDWSAPLTKEDAAILAVKLYDLINREVKK